MTDSTPQIPEALPPASETPVRRRPESRSPGQGPSGQSPDLNPAGAWRYGVIVCTLIIAMPMFSAVRGVSQPLGRVLMGVTDMIMLAMFLWSLFKPGLRTLKFLILGLLALSVLNIAFWTHDVPLTATYQGFRKSILWLLAICIGYSVRRRDRNIVLWIITGVCVVVAVYAVKQWLFGFTAFDKQMLDAQSAQEYANKIGDYQRAISILSSGFHVGMTGTLLIIIALTIKQAPNPLAWGRSAILIVIGALGIYASFTRTFMIIAAALACVQISRSGKHPLIRVGVLTAGAAIMAVGFFAGYFSQLEQAIFSDYRFTSRSISYEAMATLFSTYPVGLFSGYGLGSAGSTLGESFAIGGAHWVEPHNVLLKYVVEFGAPLSLWLYWEIGKVVRAAKPDPMLRFDNSLSMLGVFLLIGAGLTITSVETWPISLYIGFLIGMFAIPPARVVRRAPA
jgi:hypothetical protein